MKSGSARPTRSDALVLFGVTGDLAHKMIFPALYEMVEAGSPHGPGHRCGVHVRGPWPSFAARHRQHQAIWRRSEAAACSTAYWRLLHYVSGDYNDAETFAALKLALGKARAPRALPRHSAVTLCHRDRGTGSRRTGAAGARHRRKTVRPRPRLGAPAQRGRARGVSRGLDLPDRSLSREGGDHEHPLLPVRQLLSRADLEPQLHRQRADHPGGDVRREANAARSTKPPAACAT